MKKILGIEFGSTRIKSVLIDESGKVLASGGYEWENILVDGLWSYEMEKVTAGMRASFADLVKNFGEPIEHLDAIGISAMMHGYLAFDENDVLLAPFRTWRNTNTAKAAAELSELFSFNIPLRWSVAQYYESVLEGLDHVGKIRYLTTLSGYVHFLLTGKRVLGIGDASGIFPVGADHRYDREKMKKFNALLKTKGLSVDFETLIPKILLAGEEAGVLTEEGARLLDPSGKLRPGAVFCPPEGDMQTGMICTNSVAPRSANVSVGTSSNLTVILEHSLAHYYPEIDVIATPDGDSAAMIHAGTCTSVINAWVELFDEVITLSGGKIPRGELFEKLFLEAGRSDGATGGITAYNFLSGLPIAKIYHGAPMFFYQEDGKLTLANFMQAQLYSAIAPLALGIDLLAREDVHFDSVLGHGGYLKTPGVGQSALSALLKTPVTVAENAGEGGAWGIALLALYLVSEEKSLSALLSRVFAGTKRTTLSASREENEKFDAFLARYRAALPVERELTEEGR